MNIIKGIAVFLLLVLALISLYPVKFKKKQVLWIMLIPAVSLPTYLVFEAARIQATPHDRAIALSALVVTIITSAARWLLVWYMRYLKANYTYGDNTVVNERKVQVACNLIALSLGFFVLTRLW